MPDSGDCTSSSTCDPNTHDVIEFDDASWPYDDPVNTLALTTVTYGVRDGEIFEARTEINSFMHVLTIGEPSTGGDAIDLQTVLTHEAGHFLGLAHSPEQTAVMYAFYQPGLTQLTPDDEEAICSVYPPHASGCGCRLAPEGPEGMAAGLVLLMAACTFIRRRRRFRATLQGRAAAVARLQGFNEQPSRLVVLALNGLGDAVSSSPIVGEACVSQRCPPCIVPSAKATPM